MRHVLVGLVVLGAAGCAPDLRDDHPFDGVVNTGPLMQVATGADGVRLAKVDATNKGSQVYVDLDGDRELKADEAFSTGAWDLAFKRFEVSMNGGAGNPEGHVRVAVLKDIPFEALAQAPADGYQQDGATTVFSSAEGGWYYYDLGVHRLVTRSDLLYVVQTSTGAYVKLQMLSYYDEQGTPASLSFKYAPIPAP